MFDEVEKSVFANGDDDGGVAVLTAPLRREEEAMPTIRGAARAAARREVALTTAVKIERGGDPVEQAEARPRWSAE